jgi:hypothetical protein
MKKIFLGLMMTILLFGVMSAVGDKQWDVRFTSKSPAFYGFNGYQFIADSSKITGTIRQDSPSYKDVTGKVTITLYKESKVKETKMNIVFNAEESSYRGADIDGTYYIFGKADVVFYKDKRTKEKLDSVRMLLKFNPNTKDFEVYVIPTSQDTLTYVHTTIDTMKFNNYRGFDCGFEYADSFDGTYGQNEWVCVDGYVYTYNKDSKYQRYRGIVDQGILGSLLRTTDEGYKVTEYKGSSKNSIFVWFASIPNNGRVWHYYHEYARSLDSVDLGEVTHTYP